MRAGVSTCFGLVTSFNSCSRLKISAPFSPVRCRVERRRRALTHANNSCKNIGDTLQLSGFRRATVRIKVACAQHVSLSVIRVISKLTRVTVRVGTIVCPLPRLQRRAPRVRDCGYTVRPGQVLYLCSCRCCLLWKRKTVNFEPVPSTTALGYSCALPLNVPPQNWYLAGPKGLAEGT